MISKNETSLPSKYDPKNYLRQNQFVRLAERSKSQVDGDPNSILVKYALTEEDFLMALMGAKNALNKLDRHLLIEIKHLQNLNLTSLL